MKRKAFICSACFKGFDTTERASAHWLDEHEPPTCPDCGLLLDEGYCHECEKQRGDDQ
jgi:hypothetical protein